MPERRSMRLSALRVMAVTLIVMGIVCAGAHADIFTVTNSNDSGEGSLRQAILLANGNEESDTVDFAMSGVGPHTISLTRALPEITESIVINGYTQVGSKQNTLAQGSDAVLMIELDGGLIDQNGLVISAGGSRVRGMAIYGFNNRVGIQLKDTGDNRIDGCFIGTDSLGTMYKNLIGIHIENSNYNIIGGTDPASRNIISGNRIGVDLYNVSGTRIQGNYIGVDKSGTESIKNENGIILSGSNSNTLGGDEPGQGNVISGNNVAILMIDCDENSVLGNVIGRGADGITSLGNGVGILIEGDRNMIGDGTMAGSNLISDSRRYGIGIGWNNSKATENRINVNRIFGNGGLGIDLLEYRNSPGVTKNDGPGDPDDPDYGGNTLQNFPVLESATVANGTTHLVGKLESKTGTEYRIEVFGNSQADPSGHGEGEYFLKAFDITTDENGIATFNEDLGGVSQNWISCTATDPEGNTSEFSNTVPKVKDIITVTSDADSGPGSLQEGVDKVNEADTSEGFHKLEFALPDNARPISISLTLENDYTFIDGFSQPGSKPNESTAQDNAEQKVQLDGSNTSNAAGIILKGSNNVVQGLEILNFKGAAFVNHGDGNIIQGNLMQDNNGGVEFKSGQGNLIGGSSPESKNVIVGAALGGVSLGGGTATTENWVIGNVIKDGTGPGVLIEPGTGGNCIGGIGPGEGNKIYNNGASGIFEPGGAMNSIQGNSIYDNGHLGIEVGPFGITPNDDPDEDGVPNFPTVTSAEISINGLVITGELHSSPNEVFSIDFYINWMCDPSGFGEGERFLGSVVVITDESGAADFSATYLIGAAPGFESITTTATNADGQTSEFSACTIITIAP